MDFLALDVETPNKANDCPCAIGLTLVENDEVSWSKRFLVNPRESFDSFNVKLHGIKPEECEAAPTFPEVMEQLLPLLSRYPIVIHNAAFDLSVIRKACVKENPPIALPSSDVYCTMRLAAEIFPESKQCGLDCLCSRFSIPLDHHDCQSDSLACALIMIEFLKHSPDHVCPCACLSDCEGVYKTKKKSNSAKLSSWEKFLRNSGGEKVLPDLDYAQCPDTLCNMHVVVTGEHPKRSRKWIEENILREGGIISKSVTKKVDYVLVGEEYLSVVSSSGGFSTKILRAQELNEKGLNIKFLRLSEYFYW